MKKTFNTGSTKITLEQLPPEAWETVMGGATLQKPDKLFGTVAWMYRCGVIIANQVAAMPYDILNERGDLVTSSDDDTFPSGLRFLVGLPKNSYLTTLSSLFTGKAYWLRQNNRLNTPYAFHYLMPHSITAEFDDFGELTGFKRTIKNKQKSIEVDDIIHFWYPDHTVEVGPANIYPGKVALQAAGIIADTQKYKQGYFANGLVRPTIMKYAEPLTTEEAERTKSWFRMVLSGIKNAFTQQIVRSDITFETIGDSLADLSDKELTDEEREDIATAFGVPQSKVVTKSSSLSSDTRGDDARFIEDTIKPILRMLQSALNEQVFDQLGYNIKFKPDSLPVMQEDEAKRADSLNKLTSAGLSLDSAMMILGYDKEFIPEPVVEIVAPPEPEPEPVVDNSQDLVETERASLRNWISNRKKPHPSNFRSDILTYDEIARECAKKNPDVIVQSEFELKVTDTLNALYDAIHSETSTPPPQAISVNIAQQPINLNVEQPEIKAHIEVPEHSAPNVVVNTPEQPAPNVMVNVQPSEAAVVVNNEIQLPKTVTEEIVVKRDSKGLISGASSISEFKE